LTKKIFKSTVLVSAMILILGSALVMGILYRYFGKQLDGELEKEASYLAYGVEQNGVNYLEHLKKDARITYIDASGNVLYDSQADISSMENHSDRKEFEEAVQKGQGYAERMSSTLSEKTVYYARKLTDGTVLRVAAFFHIDTYASASSFRDRCCNCDADFCRNCSGTYIGQNC